MSTGEAAASVLSLESYHSLEVYYPDERTNQVTRSRKSPDNIVTVEAYHPEERTDKVPRLPKATDNIITLESYHPDERTNKEAVARVLEGEADLPTQVAGQVPALLKTNTSPYTYRFDPETTKALREVATELDCQSGLKPDPTLIDPVTVESITPDIVREIVVLPPKHTKSQHGQSRHLLRTIAVSFSLGLGVGVCAMWLLTLLK